MDLEIDVNLLKNHIYILLLENIFFFSHLQRIVNYSNDLSSLKRKSRPLY